MYKLLIKLADSLYFPPSMYLTAMDMVHFVKLLATQLKGI